MATFDPQTGIHRLSGTPRKTLPAGKGRDSPPGGVGSATGGPGRLQLPAPPRHPAQATPPTRPSAENATVAETRSSCRLPQRPRPSYLGVASRSDPPTSPQVLHPLWPRPRPPPRFQLPIVVSPPTCPRQLRGPSPRCSALSPPPRLLSSVERGSYALYRPDSPTLWSPGQVKQFSSPKNGRVGKSSFPFLPFSS